MQEKNKSGSNGYFFLSEANSKISYWSLTTKNENVSNDLRQESGVRHPSILSLPNESE